MAKCYELSPVAAWFLLGWRPHYVVLGVGARARVGLRHGVLAGTAGGADLGAAFHRLLAADVE
jgi:hypothetical protein